MKPARRPRSSAPATTRTGGVITTTAKRESRGQLVESTETIKAHDLPEHPARVRVAGGLTRSLGNYEFLRVDVSIELPCACAPSALDAAYTRASDWVAERIALEVEKAGQS